MTNKALNVNLTIAQAAFLKLDCAYPAFFAGLGGGKSYIMGLRAVLNAHDSKEAIVGVYEPTHELVRQVAVPAVLHWLKQLGYDEGKDYTYNKNEHVIKSSSVFFGDILFKSLDNLDLLIGYQTSSAHVDELDTLTQEKAEEAWRKVVDRNRLNLHSAGEDKKTYSKANQRWEYINRVCAYSSPEGFKFCNRRWKEIKSDSYQCVHGSTRDNPAISEAYITERTQHMSKEQIAAYIDGQFVNFATGSVYHCYNRHTHNSNETVREDEVVYIGCDFNVGHMACTVYVRRNGGRDWHAVDEMHSMLDTPEMIRTIKARYFDKGHKVIMYPDSSGGGRHASNASISSITLLRDAGFEVRARKKNPAVLDRIEATNQCFRENRLFINYFNCPETTRCLEQQGWDKDNKPDKSSGTDHQCFSGEQLVNVNNKLIKFKDIPETGTVLCPDGKYRAYNRGGIVKESSRMLLLTLSNGVKIECTPDHQFLTLEGWKKAEDLLGVKLCNQKSLALLNKYTRGLGTTCAETTFNEKGLDYIGKFGKMLTETYRQVMSFTTSTMTKETTILKTLRYFLKGNTLVTTAGKIQEHLLKQLRQLSNGMRAQRVCCGIDNTTKKPNIYYIERGYLSAVTATKLTKEELQGSIGIAQVDAHQQLEERQGLMMRQEVAQCVDQSLQEISTKKQKHVVDSAVEVLSIKELPKQPAYCLTVPDYGYFAVDSVIVSNCDATTYPIAYECAIKAPVLHVDFKFAQKSMSHYDY